MTLPDTARRLMVSSILLVLAASAAPAATMPGSSILAAYVVLAESPIDGTVPIARLIVPAGHACPRLLVEGRAIETTARRNPHPPTFPVEVCEARYPFDRRARIEGTDTGVPAVKRRPRHLVVLGDTGCDGGTAQDCGKPTSWPFGELAAAAARTGPDLVIHVGDYNYRGTPGEVTVDGRSLKVYDAGDNVPVRLHCRLPHGYASQNVPGSDAFDNWQDWRDDFFEPARDLLGAAPWVFARGNHELCSRAGFGWFYFLDPGSNLLGAGMEQRACPPQDGIEPRLFTPPYRLDLDGLDLVVMDTANACDFYPNLPAVFAQQLSKVRQLIGAAPTWLVTHRPVWGVTAASEEAPPDESYQVLNRTLQQALRQRPDAALPPAVRLVVSGHMHRFQSLAFGTGRPAQLTVGNGGVVLDTRQPIGRFSTTAEGSATEGLGIDGFGYLDVLLGDRDAWHGRLVNPLLTAESQLLAECRGQPAIGGSLCWLPKE